MCFTTLFAQGGYPRIAIGGAISFDYITNVTFAGINKTTTYNTTQSDSSYCDYTSNTATVYVNNTDQISINLSGFLSSSDKYYANAYIDWNIDGDWDDAGETIVVASNISASSFPQTADILVPSGASLGTSRMRIVIRYNAAPQNSGTPAFSYGEAEDYTLNVAEMVSPTITTQAVSAITSSTATGNGTITNLGIPNPYAHGVCWNTSSNPTISNSKTDEGFASTTGAFTSSIADLSGKTTYYVRAYATNISATVYGDEVTFTTLNNIPTCSNNTVNTSFYYDKTFSIGDFNFSDNDIGDELSSVKITTLETAGELYLDTNNNDTVDPGEDVTLNQEIQSENISKLKLKHNSSVAASPFATFQFKVSDGTEYSSGTCTMTINVINPYPRIAIGGARSYDYITNVTFAGINNTTTYNNTQSDSSYCDYTSNTATVQVNSTEEISINLSGYLSSTDKYYAKAYIDWNRDGDWDDADETIVVASNISASSFPQSASITVPSGASLGKTQMRVVIRYNAAPVSSGTPAFSYGEAEDYTVLIDNVLPVELVSFSALTDDGNVILSWNTATEINNYGFGVERNAVSLQSGGARLRPSEPDYAEAGWETLGFVNGHGNSNSPKSYTLTDTPIGGTTFKYRLKQIDFDGAFEYSDEIEVIMGHPNNYELGQNYPNPFNPSTAIKFKLPVSSKVSITIYDMLGQEVARLIDEEKPAGSHIVYWNSENNYGRKVASGVYVYTIKANDYYQSRKMVLTK